MRYTRLAITLILALGTACSDSVTASTLSHWDLASTAADFRTDSAAYILTSTNVGYHGTITATFTNTSGKTAYFVNCNGGTGVELQKLTGAEWKTVWSPVLLACLSAP